MNKTETQKQSSGKKLKAVGIACFCLGLVLLVVGWLMGANFMLYIDGGNIRFANKHIVNLSDNLEFSSIIVTSNIADVEITATNDVFGATFTTYFNDVEFHYSINHNTLHIYIYKTPSFVLSAGFVSIPSNITIHIPNNLELNRIEVNNLKNDTVITGVNTATLGINSVDGNVHLSRVTARTSSIHLIYGNGLFYDVYFELLEFSAVYGNNTITNSTFGNILAGSNNAGNFSFYNCYAENFNVDTRYGNITAQKLVSNEIYIRNVSGNVVLHGNFNGRSEISNTEGNVVLNIIGTEYDFNFSITSFGNILINNEPAIITRVERVNAPNQLRVISRTGNMYVTFLYDIYN